MVNATIVFALCVSSLLLFRILYCIPDTLNTWNQFDGGSIFATSG